jgi:RimJ/RimL family protein N-acetyltransferase
LDSPKAIASERIKLRAATFADCERVWQWNFAPDVRAASLSSHTPTYEEHVKWYTQRVAGNWPMWIVLEDATPVGVVRLDDADPKIGRARISIALASEARGRGIGKRAIRTVCERWGRPMIAEILSTNTASRACFEACGFIATDRNGDVAYYRWRP